MTADLRRYPRTNAGKEMYRLAEAVAVKLEPDGGGPFVDVAVLAVEMIRQTILEIEDEAQDTATARIAALTGETRTGGEGQT